MKIKISDLFPGLSEEEQRIAAENLDRYLELAWEIWQEGESGDG
jgi:TRAP-type C4-dicarboxylate transport system substrate-binding protein